MRSVDSNRHGGGIVAVGDPLSEQLGGFWWRRTT
jgi:hypothetical protein